MLVFVCLCLCVFSSGDFLSHTHTQTVCTSEQVVRTEIVCKTKRTWRLVRQRSTSIRQLRVQKVHTTCTAPRSTAQLGNTTQQSANELRNSRERAKFSHAKIYINCSAIVRHRLRPSCLSSIRVVGCNSRSRQRHGRAVMQLYATRLAIQMEAYLYFCYRCGRYFCLRGFGFVCLSYRRICHSVVRLVLLELCQ